MILNQCFKVRYLILAAALSIGLGFLSPAFAQQVSFLIDINSKEWTRLGDLGGGYTRAEDLNDVGQVIGYSKTSKGYDRAFITGPNGIGMTDLGTLGGDNSYAQGINNAGQIVGESGGSAFITGNNGVGMRSLDIPVTQRSEANGINEAGQVVGWASSPGARSEAFITGSDGMGVTDLEWGHNDYDQAYNVAYDVNDFGQVVGFSFRDPLFRDTFVTAPGSLIVKHLDLVRYGTVSSGIAINNVGQVVSNVTSFSKVELPPGFPNIFYRILITGADGGTIFVTSRDASQMQASDINDAGAVVGSFEQRGVGWHAFIRDPDGSITDLNSLIDLPDGVILTNATGINDAGQVVAIGTPPIPEPHTYAMLLAGLSLVGFMYRRKKRASPITLRSSKIKEDSLMKTNHCSEIRRFIVNTVLLTALGFIPTTFAQQTSFIIDINSKTWTKLGELGSAYVRAEDINDAGQVVGTAGQHPFITGPDGVGMTDLAPNSSGRAFGINNSGQVVGDLWTNFVYAFVTGPNGNGAALLGTLGGTYSSAKAINDMQQVVGDSYLENGELPNAFITGPMAFPTTAGMRPLGQATYSTAMDINNEGQVVGYWDSPYIPGPDNAYITGPDGNGVSWLGTLGGPFSESTAINEIGQVVGSSWIEMNNSTEHAFITGPDGIGMLDLGTVGGSSSKADDLNDIGQVVGSSQTPAGDWHAFVTGPDGMNMTDLNSLVDLPHGVILNQANGINNRGQVIAVAIIPEPAPYLLMLVGLALVSFIAREKSGTPLKVASKEQCLGPHMAPILRAKNWQGGFP